MSSKMVLISAPPGARTLDTLIKSQVLYQLMHFEMQAFFKKILRMFFRVVFFRTIKADNRRKHCDI